MYYRKQDLPKKIKQRIMRRKRNRYHDDAALHHEDTYSTPRKRTKALIKRDKEKKEESNSLGEKI